MAAMLKPKPAPVVYKYMLCICLIIFLLGGFNTAGLPHLKIAIFVFLA